jgi:hypothetical protein
MWLLLSPQQLCHSLVSLQLFLKHCDWNWLLTTTYHRMLWWVCSIIALYVGWGVPGSYLSGEKGNCRLFHDIVLSLKLKIASPLHYDMALSFFILYTSLRTNHYDSSYYIIWANDGANTLTTNKEVEYNHARERCKHPIRSCKIRQVYVDILNNT